VAEPNPVVDAPEDGAAVRWGLGDALIGFVVSVVGSQITLAIALAASDTPARRARELPLGWLAVAQLGLWLGLLGVPWLAAKYKGRGMREDFGLRATWGDVGVGTAWGLAGQLLIVPLVYVPLHLLFDFDSDDISGPAREITDRAAGPVGVILLILIVGIGAPIVEEIFYRGLLQRSMIRRFGPVAGIAITAVLFGAAHFEPLQFAALALAGALFGTLAYRTGRLGPSIFAHMVFNLTAVVSLLVAR
jgi:membrane protease YdiL (CAAX protease family)